MPLALCGLLLAVACWWKMPAITAYLGERFGWFRQTEDAGDHAVTTLLQVVDVGEVYRRKLGAVAQAGTAHGGGQDRRRIKLAFQTEAAGPLLQQVDLFTALAADGIQQGGRPDREAERLRALAGQGRILEQELRRLELAWFSLAGGVDWQDLGTLDDARVASRRDSLGAAARSALAAASQEVGAAAAWPRMHTARQQVTGMSGLLGAFAAKAWSVQWEQNLFASAEHVSPAASDATRAYRNGAFALVRLKRAERTAEARDLPFAEAFGDGTWPAPGVREVLVDLRRQAGRFDDGAVPPVLAGTLELYAALERAGTLARQAATGEALAALERNPAVVFDRERYGDYLERIRFEAARTALAAGTDPPGIPRHLYAGRDSLMAGRFHAALAETSTSAAWRIETLTQEHPFLARWAEHQADRALARERERRGRFDGQWQQCVALHGQVVSRAAEGRDWTAQWLDLRDRTVALLDGHVRQTGGDREMAARLTRAADLVRAMSEARSLGLTAVTVRFVPDVFAEPTPVVLELLGAGRTVPLRSAPLTVGPAAPAGTGWVGSAALAWRVDVGAGDALAVRVLDLSGGELMQVDYPSLNDRVGPGAMARPRGPDVGSVSFQLDPAWWFRPELPALE
ncbi:MAG: hypothetical protein IH621_09805 [Krumholzibacteria bacterium]|nr:hypothetical protein [Candidatus Krumholzibacteria bacterium]